MPDLPESPLIQNYRRMKEYEALLEDARYKARYDPEEEENIEYFQSEIERLENEIRHNPSGSEDFEDFEYFEDVSPTLRAHTGKIRETLRRAFSEKNKLHSTELRKKRRQSKHLLQGSPEAKALSESGSYQIEDTLGVLDDFLSGVLSRQIEWSFEDVSQSGFDFLCYGIFKIKTPRKDTVRGSYNAKLDQIAVSAPEALVNRLTVYGDSFVLVPPEETENLAARFTNPRFRWTLVHELGHRLHYRFGSHIDMKKARQVYVEGKKGAFVSKYAKTNPHEMIAEAFACYVMPNYYLIKRGLPPETVYRALRYFQKYMKVPLASADERLAQMIRVNPTEE